MDYRLRRVFDYNYCEYDRLYGLGCTHGTVVDEAGNPVEGIEVNLIPLWLKGDARRWNTGSQWTDKEGRFNLNRISPGNYWVAINAIEGGGAPSATHPYATVYYPQAASGADAGTVEVTKGQGTYLSPMITAKNPHPSG